MTYSESEALAYRPFDGDETDTTELSDKFVVTRKNHVCNIFSWNDAGKSITEREKTGANNRAMAD